MKFLALLLSIYIFGLNLVPCVDNDISGNKVKSEISQALDNDHQHQDTDFCSPFCQCNCCHIHVTHFKAVDYSLSNTIISARIQYHFPGAEKDFKRALLQPPQV